MFGISMIIGMICWHHNGWFCVSFLSKPCIGSLGWPLSYRHADWLPWHLLHVMLAGFGRWCGSLDFIENLMACHSPHVGLLLIIINVVNYHASHFLLFIFRLPGVWSFTFKFALPERVKTMWWHQWWSYKASKQLSKRCQISLTWKPRTGTRDHLWPYLSRGFSWCEKAMKRKLSLLNNHHIPSTVSGTFLWHLN